jgi:hypothetical protein
MLKNVSENSSFLYYCTGKVIKGKEKYFYPGFFGAVFDTGRDSVADP